MSGSLAGGNRRAVGNCGIGMEAKAVSNRKSSRTSTWVKRSLVPMLFGVAVAIATFGGPSGLTLANAEDAASGCQNPPRPQKLEWPVNIGLLPDQLIVYRCTDYLNDIAGTLAKAREWVQQRAPQIVKPAVVFDIDETSLSNWEQIYHNKFAYVPAGACDLSAPALCGGREWELSARATALQPTLAFYRFLKTLRDKNGDGIAVFFVTGRYEDPSERIATDWNLRKEGYDAWEGLYLRPESSRKDDFVSTYKSGARAKIESRGYTIIANIGDQLSDLVGDHAERCFKIANPFYFIPGTDAPESGLRCLSH
jgi:HAD superfamily, subfamily IIIB (Acid phosphatase)